MTVAELQKEARYRAIISRRMSRDEYVSLDSIEKICRVLCCKVDDIVEFLSDDAESGGKSRG